MIDALGDHIKNTLGIVVKSIVPVSGGDISTALKITSPTDRFFCKYHPGKKGHLMLGAEKEGLLALAATSSVKTPEIMHLGQFMNGGYLLMEYIESKTPGTSDMQLFGGKLARLHGIHDHAFGWDSDNFIGSLPQKNDRKALWADFYSTQRLLPQYAMALQKGLLSKDEIPTAESLKAGIDAYCHPARPSLVHGDLWGGNYLISSQGEVYLIDPSVSYSHPGADIAMSRLFGGFSAAFYNAYEEASNNPLPDEQETELYQLYYVLVHLNLFGGSYASSVRRITRKYFQI
jgi:fructosamine-3-kinase